MVSMLMKNPVTSSSDRSILARRKKKKRSLTSTNQNTIINQNDDNNDNNNNNNRDSISEWKSQAQQQIYSSKLLKALRQVQTSKPAPKGGQAVRKVADRVLAITAKGRSRWSRAILTNRIKLKFMKRLSKRQRVGSASATTTSRLPKKPRVSMLKLRTKHLPAFQKKARVLSHIVPGCRKQPLPVVLEEATDYIAALEMQIRAMNALADLLSGASASNTPLDQLGSSQPPPS